MTKKYNLFALINPTQAANRGVAIAIEKVVRERLGSELKSYQAITRELIGVVEVDETTEMGRLLDPEQYRAFYPSIIRVEVEAV